MTERPPLPHGMAMAMSRTREVEKEAARFRRSRVVDPRPFECSFCAVGICGITDVNDAVFDVLARNIQFHMVEVSEATLQGSPYSADSDAALFIWGCPLRLDPTIPDGTFRIHVDPSLLANQ